MIFGVALWLVLTVKGAPIFDACFAAMLAKHQDLRTVDPWLACAESSVNANEPLKVVQIGANDGVMVDPMHDLEMNARKSHGRRVKHVFVEPIPLMMSQLRENKAKMGFDADEFRFVQAAITPDCPETGKISFFQPKFETIGGREGFEWIKGIGSLNVPKGRREGDFDKVEVECQSPDALADAVIEHGAESPHVLVIDAEGMDAVIIESMGKAGWPFGRPQVISFELWKGEGMLPKGTVEHLYEFLGQHGYMTISMQTEDHLAFDVLGSPAVATAARAPKTAEVATCSCEGVAQPRVIRHERSLVGLEALIMLGVVALCAMMIKACRGGDSTKTHKFDF